MRWGPVKNRKDLKFLKVVEKSSHFEDNGPFFENSTRARVNGTETETDRLTDGLTDRRADERTDGHRKVSKLGLSKILK